MIRQTLQDLPNGLAQTYERILMKISKSSLARQELALRAFRWTICTRRPMETQELQEAVAFDIWDTSWDGEKIPDGNLMIETCRGLLVRDKEDGTVRFAHHTVQQYLLTAPSIKIQQQLHGFPFRRFEAEAFVGQVCITYLCFSDFETQIARRIPGVQHEPLDISRIGGPVSIPTALGVGKAVAEIPYRFFGGKPTRAPLAIDYSKYLTPITRSRPQVPSDLVEKYRLLNYVVEYWVEHTKGLELDKKFRHLVMHKTLSCELRPWGLNQHFGHYGCTSCPDPSKAAELPFTKLFHYAAQVGHWSLMEPLVAEYCQHEVPNNETLLIASSRGQDGIVRKLTDTIAFDLSDGRAVSAAVAAGHSNVLQSLLELSHNVKLSSRKSSLYEFAEHAVSLLNLAATKGHEEVMDCILAFHESHVSQSQNFHLLDLKDKRTGHTALFSAVVNGHEHIVRNLLAKGAKVQAHGTTAAHFAAQYGRQDMLGMLLQTTVTDDYIDTEDRIDLFTLIWGLDRELESPLHKAAKNGHSAVVNILLSFWLHGRPVATSEDINNRNGDGYTPLNSAARGGHLGVLEILIQHGARINLAEYKLGWTALHFAAARGHEAVIHLLLQNGANPAARAKDGATALELAVSGDQDGGVRAFLKSYKLSVATFYDENWDDIVASIERAIKKEKGAALRVLLDGLTLLGKLYVENALLIAKRKKYQRAVNELKAILKERSLEWGGAPSGIAAMDDGS